MTNEIDALYGAATTQASDGQLQRVSQLLAEESDTNAEKLTLEALLATVKERLHELRTDRIPSAMDDAGVTEFRDANGLKATITFQADGALGSPRTPEEFAERERKLDLIEEHGGREIIKMTVSVTFDREEWDRAESLRADLAAQNYRVEMLRTIHPMTLKKWVKERMESGAALPLEQLGLWWGRVAKIQRPRAG